MNAQQAHSINEQSCQLGAEQTSDRDIRRFGNQYVYPEDF